MGYFEEYLTVHNLEPQAIQVMFTFYRPDGSTASHTATIFAGPGRLRLKVRDLNLSLGDHGTKVVATRLDTGAPVKVVAERTMEWETDRREGHSTPGTASLSSAWQFAEGNKGGFDTYLAFLNPSNTSVIARVLYRHENLVDYAYDVTVPAHARATLLTPAGVPDGGFALSVSVLEGVPIAVERMLYGGDVWTVGTAGVGSIGAGTTWRFSEGITTSPFDTYFQVLNLGFSTTVTFTFVLENGTTLAQGVWVLGAERVPSSRPFSVDSSHRSSACFWPSAAIPSGLDDGTGDPAEDCPSETTRSTVNFVSVAHHSALFRASGDSVSMLPADHAERPDW